MKLFEWILLLLLTLGLFSVLSSIDLDNDEPIIEIPDFGNNSNSTNTNKVEPDEIVLNNFNIIF